MFPLFLIQVIHGLVSYNNMNVEQNDNHGVGQSDNLDDDDYNVQLYSQIEVQIGMILDTILDGLRTPTK